MLAASLLALVALPAFSLAGSSYKKCYSKGNIDANYDGLTFQAVLPAANTITEYKYLTYNAFAGLTTSTTGVQPHSRPNDIVTGFEQTTTDGTAYIEADAKKGISYFDFKSFYYGCALNTVTAAVGVPTTCTVTIKGYHQGHLLATQEFYYSSPEGTLNENQKKADPSYGSCHSGFTGVDKVEFTTDDPTTQALILDDLDYVPYSCS